MTANALTDTQLRTWIKTGVPLARADGSGLTFTLSAAGTAAWVLRYRFGGAPRELTLGRYPDLSLAEARKLARLHRARVQQGEDVARAKRREKRAAAAAWTFAQLAHDYKVKAFPTLAASTREQRERHLAMACQRLGGLTARDVDPADIALLIEQIGMRSRSMAEVVLTAVNEAFKHGIARRVVVANPCAGLTVGAICGKTETRERVMLAEPELRALLAELPTIGIENALTVKILLATCVRISELALAEWSHLDFDKAEWFIPPENSKTRNGFTVPLVPAVIGWFRELQPLACGSRYVLPARRTSRAKGADAPFEQRSLNAMLHKLCDRLGDHCRRFTPHDLRSTARSWLAAMGVAVPVAERCLNHSLGGLLAIYDQHDYMTERRAALEGWTTFLLAREAGQSTNMVPLRRAG